MKLQQLLRQLYGCSLDPFLYPGPFSGAQAAEAGWPVLSANESGDSVQVVGGHVELVLLGVLQHQVLLVFAVLCQLGCTSEPGNTVIYMDHEAAGDQISQRHLWSVLRPAGPAMSALLDRAEEFRVG